MSPKPAPAPPDIDDGTKPGTTSQDNAEVREARRRIKLLEQENDVLRRAAACLSQAHLRFTLTHMTGYVQPKAEWPAEMKAGRFLCHSIDEVDTTLDLDGGTARLTVRTMTDATVYGSRADGRLLLTTDYGPRGDTWIPLRTVATTW